MEYFKVLNNNIKKNRNDEVGTKLLHLGLR